MGIRIENVRIVFESVGGNAIDPSMDLMVDEDEIENYIKKNPFPESENYTKDDFINDMLSSGFLELPNNLKDETEDYIAEFIEEYL